MERRAEGRVRAIAAVASLALLLAACASPPPGSDGDLTSGIGSYRVGSPYQMNGVWYYPAVDYDYDRTGIASWYGEEFEGRLTANGEIFDLNALTAAHTTLPLPSIVQVTNLENGRSLQLRINDRGPFVDGRLIDVSRRAAQLLGFESRGTARVRVTILKDESIAAAEEAMHNSASVMVAAALPKTSRAYAAASEPRWSPRPTRSVERQSAPATQIAGLSTELRHAPRTQTAMVPAEPPPAPARQTATAMRPESFARNRPAAGYRFSLISRAEAAEIMGFRTSARKSEDAHPSAPVEKMPPSRPRIAAAPKGSTGRIYVRAGAFSQRDNAERAQRRISHGATFR
jgi:rare lipoprotein A